MVTQALKICKAHKIQTNVPPILHRLLSTLTFQEPQSRYQNESRKSRGGGGCKSKPQQVRWRERKGEEEGSRSGATELVPRYNFCLSLFTHTHTHAHAHAHTHTHTHPLTHTHQLSSHLPESSFLPPTTFQPLEDMSSLELPHSCSNGSEEQCEATSIRAPHRLLCDDTLLCLLDPRHEENITVFQERWRRGEVGSIFLL